MNLQKLQKIFQIQLFFNGNIYHIKEYSKLTTKEQTKSLFYNDNYELVTDIINESEYKIFSDVTGINTCLLRKKCKCDDCDIILKEKLPCSEYVNWQKQTNNLAILFSFEDGDTILTSENTLIPATRVTMKTYIKIQSGQELISNCEFSLTEFDSYIISKKDTEYEKDLTGHVAKFKDICSDPELLYILQTKFENINTTKLFACLNSLDDNEVVSISQIYDKTNNKWQEAQFNVI